VQLGQRLNRLDDLAHPSLDLAQPAVDPAQPPVERGQPSVDPGQCGVDRHQVLVDWLSWATAPGSALVAEDAGTSLPRVRLVDPSVLMGRERDEAAIGPA